MVAKQAVVALETQRWLSGDHFKTDDGELDYSGTKLPPV